MPKAQFSVRIDPAIHENIRQESGRTGLSMSELVEHILAKYYGYYTTTTLRDGTEISQIKLEDGTIVQDGRKTRWRRLKEK